MIYRRDRSEHGVFVDFRVNSATLDPRYRNNSTVISRVDSLFKSLKEDTTITIEAVEFSGTASPEGSSPLNSRLSRARMYEVEKYVRKHISFDDQIVTYNDRYVDWNHLVELVEGDTTLSMREDVLRIVKGSYPDAKDAKGQPVDGRVPELKKLNDGKVWRELLRRYFVKMRTGAVIMRTYVDVPVVVEKSEPAAPVEDPMEVISEEYTRRGTSAVGHGGHGIDDTGVFDTGLSAEYQKTPLMGVKTNLLAYSTLIPNVGVEFRLAEHWSAEITALYSPFNLFVHDFKTRVLATKPEVRYWFGEAMRRGHFVGVHVPIAGFNIQLNDNYRYQDSRHALWGLGLNYGYAMLLGKEQKWSIDFTIGFGYMDLRYDVYEGVRNGKYIRSEMKHYFGPTRIGINLSYLINQKRGK